MIGISALRRWTLCGFFLLFSGIFALAPQRGLADETPIAAYSFDEGEGETAEDLTGNGHTATIEGASWSTHGRYGGAMEFDASEEDVLKVPDSPELDFSEEFTLEAWVHPSGEESSWAPIVAKQQGGGKGAHRYAYWLHESWEGANYPAGGFETSTEGQDREAVPTEHLSENHWTHLAITFDGAKLRLYVDGELVKDESTTGMAQITEGDLQIGGSTEHGDFFNGRIDEVRIYNRALGGGEVAADQAAPIQTPQQTPIAAYSFDEGEGETAEDLTGNGHTATIEGASWSTHGRYGGAMEFDASEEDVLKVPDSPELDFSEEFTLEAWVHPSGEESSWAPIVAKQQGGGKGAHRYAYWLHESWEGANYPAGGFETSTEGQDREAVPTEHLSENHWTHLAITFDGAKLRLYVDGELVKDESTTGMAQITEGDLQIGGSTEHGDFFNGRIDEVRIYNRALGGGEVAADQAAPIQTPQQTPIAAYSFDEGEGETAEDLTGNGHTATIEGASWSTHGRYGGAMEFDASEEDVLKVPDSPELDFSEEFTLEAWVHPSGEESSWAPIVAKQQGGGKGAHRYAYWLHESWEGANYPAGGFETSTEGQDREAVPTEHLSENHWTHLAITFDGAKLRLYVDGELVKDESTTGMAQITEGDLQIGGSTEHGDFFNGRIDEVRIYNRALGGGEVAADQAAPIQTPQQTPIAAYSFDEGEGETAEDLTGNGHTATIEGASWSTHGRYGGAMEFDASEEDVLKVPDSPELDFSEEFTLEAWVHPSGEESSWAPIVAKQQGGGKGAHRYAYWLHESWEGANYPAGGFETSTEGQDREAVPTEHLSENHWTHLAITFDGAKLRLYVDGELVKDESTTGMAQITEGDLQIGGSTEHGDFFNGRIDEVRIYNRALGGGEVAADQAAPIQTPQQTPIAAYSFDEGEGETAEDLTGNGHTATIEGASWSTHGRYGGAMEFDASEEDVLKVPDSPELDFSEEFTLEAWVHPSGEESSWAPIVAKQQGGGKGAHRYAYWLHESWEGANYPAGGFETSTEGQDREAVPTEHLSENHWTHLAITFDGAKLRLYVDGELVKDESTTGMAQITEGDLQIGGSTEHGDFFNGRIDEVRIYNRALGGMEVAPDIRPPTQPTDLDAMFEEEEVDNTFVTWNPSVDPTESDGRAGSGVNAYRYRYRLESGPWSQWQETSMASFGIPNTVENEAIGVDVLAEDNEGNLSPLRYAQLISRPPTLTEAEPGREEPTEVGPDGIVSEPVHSNPAENEESGSGEALALLSGDELCPEEENPCGKYDWKGAMEYAERWTLWGETSTQVDKHHNHEFLYLGGNGGDCTNFASQVLWGGNMQYMRTRGHDSPDIDANGENHFGDYRYGQGSWWSGYFYRFGQPPKLFRTPTESWDNAHKLFEHLVEYGLAEPLNGQPVRAGDLIFYDLYHGTSIEHIDHTQVVERVTHHTIWVAQHSPAFLRTLKHEKTHVRKEYGTRGEDWEMWIMRPTHTKANL